MANLPGFPAPPKLSNRPGAAADESVFTHAVPGSRPSAALPPARSGPCSALQNFPRRAPSARRTRASRVDSSMTVASVRRPSAACMASFRRASPFSRLRHATCWKEIRSPNVSPALGPHVQSASRFGIPAALVRERAAWNGRHHGAGRNGYREHTCVRGTCGGAIRTSGGGTQSSHGHFGRSVGRVRKSIFALVVTTFGCEASPRRRHLPRGTGLPTAALSRSRLTFIREPAPAGRAVSATRRQGSNVIRATPGPSSTAEEFRGRPGRTRPEPRMRRRRFHRGT
jgi:hypothetical protein